jgi:LysM repeat protein
MEKPEKAKFTNAKNGKVVECDFNPDQFEITKAAGWSEKPSMGNNEPELVFSGGSGQEFTISNLLFDTTGTGQDVRQKYKDLFEMVMVDKDSKNQKTKKSEPPTCQFQWGKFLSFSAVIKEIKQKFTLFKRDGTPLRVEVTITLKQVAQKPQGQNPTSRSEARKIWIVEEGQRLDWIAYQEYNDSAQWRYIAEVNNLNSPDIYPGQVLKLIPLP